MLGVSPAASEAVPVTLGVVTEGVSNDTVTSPAGTVASSDTKSVQSVKQLYRRRVTALGGAVGKGRRG